MVLFSAISTPNFEIILYLSVRLFESVICSLCQRCICVLTNLTVTVVVHCFVFSTEGFRARTCVHVPNAFPCVVFCLDSNVKLLSFWWWISPPACGRFPTFADICSILSRYKHMYILYH